MHRGNNRRDRDDSRGRGRNTEDKRWSANNDGRGRRKEDAPGWGNDEGPRAENRGGWRRRNDEEEPRRQRYTSPRRSRSRDRRDKSKSREWRRADNAPLPNRDPHMREPVREPKHSLTRTPSYEGTVIDYNDMKGFGFIECDETRKIYGQDIFLLRSALAGQMVNAGDKVSFFLQQGPKGPMVRSLKVVQKVQDKVGKAELPTFVGRLNYLYGERDYGFIESEGAQAVYKKDIMVMKSQLDPFAREGDCVQFSVLRDLKGDKAVNIVPYHGEIPVIEKPAWWAQATEDLDEEFGGQEFWGLVRDWDEKKGLGFITCEEARQALDQGTDVFLDKGALSVATVKDGDTVCFTIVKGQTPWGTRGPVASNVRTVGPDGMPNQPIVLKKPQKKKPQVTTEQWRAMTASQSNPVEDQQGGWQAGSSNSSSSNQEFNFRAHISSFASENMKELENIFADFK